MPQGELVTKELLDIWSQAAEQATKRKLEQGVPSTQNYQEGNEVWVVNPNTSKLQPEKIGPYVVVQVSKETNTYTLQDHWGKQQKLHLNSLSRVNLGLYNKNNKTLSTGPC